MIRPALRVAFVLAACLLIASPAHAYLDPGVRGAMSTFTKLATLEPGLTHLRRDLEDGSWERRHLHLLAKSELDLGYRLVIATIAGRRRS